MRVQPVLFFMSMVALCLTGVLHLVEFASWEKHQEPKRIEWAVLLLALLANCWLALSVMLA